MQGAGNRQLNQLLAQGASAGASGLQSPGQARGSEQQLEQIRATAREGLSGSGTQLPFADQIQASFGEHEVSSVQAHVGDGAKAAASSMGAAAYAAGGQVAFGEAPSLRTAAHEAAHVVQQRQGVALPGGVGQAGDRHEQQADQVADRVVAGQPATDL
ncbi:MAG: DUF4157 domain-containing protein, partial [Deltaproteobacteria bacterium]|nr:DUF4157 domain-containing protein [Deltaproteobacteria bacterium]